MSGRGLSISLAAPLAMKTMNKAELSHFYCTSEKAVMFPTHKGEWWCVWVCVWATDPTSRPPAPLWCALSDGPTRCCTWSRSEQQVWPCSRDWQLCSWWYKRPPAPAGSVGGALEGRWGRSPAAHPTPTGSHHHLGKNTDNMKHTAFWCVSQFQLDDRFANQRFQHVWH